MKVISFKYAANIQPEMVSCLRKKITMKVSKK